MKKIHLKIPKAVFGGLGTKSKGEAFDHQERIPLGNINCNFFELTLTISMENFEFSSETVVLGDFQPKNSYRKDVFEALESKFSWFLAGDMKTTPEL